MRGERKRVERAGPLRGSRSARGKRTRSCSAQKGDTSPISRSDSPGSKAFAVLARMRRTGESLEAASRERNTYPRVVLRHLQGEFRKIHGRWVPSKSDRQPRRKLLLTEDGYLRVTVLGSKKAAELNQFNQIVARLVEGKGDPSELEFFTGRRIAGHPYLTDIGAILRLADAGVIRVEELGSDQVVRGGPR